MWQRLLLRIVKRIFLLANEGKSPREIAEILTEEKVLIPSAHAKKYHPEQYNGIKFTDNIRSCVDEIVLNDIVYS